VYVEIRTEITKSKVKCKARAFTNHHVEVIEEVLRVFEQYEKLTRKSGLELNADKTEIFALSTGRSLTYDVETVHKTLRSKQ
jgi:hypothetical protein